MKKFFATILMSLGLLSAAHAAPGCVFYWSPQTLFFQAGGVVYVTHSNGTEYQVNASNVVSGAQYGLQDGDSVIVYPPDCSKWYWGWSYFCPCNSQGGVTCGLAQPLQVAGAIYLHETAWEQCNCPNGSSDAGFHFVFQKYCQLPPP